MRVAIVTLQLHTNCGGVLQAYALQTVLKSLGHHSEILQLHEIVPVPRGLHRWWKICSRTLRRAISHDHNAEPEREKRINREFPIVGAEYLRFFDKHLNIRRISSFEEIRPGEYDAFVVGSDQVWRPVYNPSLLHSYLDFTKGWNVRRLAYSVSFGTSEWEYSASLTASAADLARSFDALSFREQSGCANCLKYLGLSSELMPDPTLLLKPADYLCLVNKGGRKNKKQVFEYILDRSDNSLQQLQAVLASAFPDGGYEEECFLNSDPRGRGPVSGRVQKSPEQWLEGISGADLVVTDSFHACVFALLFHRNFIVLRNDSRGFSRIETLLGQFSLLETMGAGPQTCWAEVDAKIEALRDMGRTFLYENLSEL